MNMVAEGVKTSRAVVDLARAVAVPGALGFAATAASRAPEPRPELHVVPDPDADETPRCYRRGHSASVASALSAKLSRPRVSDFLERSTFTVVAPTLAAATEKA